MNHLAVEDGNTQHRFLSQLDSSSSVNMIAMTIDRTEGRATDPKTAVEKEGSRINQECRLLHLPLNRPENPQVWKGSV